MKINLDLVTDFIDIPNKNFSNTFLLSNDLIGAIDDHTGKFIPKSDVISRVKKIINQNSITDLKLFFGNIIGNCSLIISNSEYFYCINSSTSPGLFYHFNNDKIYITDKEYETFKSLKSLVINSYASSFLFHQGLIRDSKNTLNKTWNYLCSGCDLFLKNGNEKRSFYFSELPPIKLSFGIILESIIKAYSDNMENLFVAKSGGIDSCCLALAYSKYNPNGKLIHIPYFGKSTTGFKTSNEIAKILGLKLELAESYKSNSNLNSGLGISVGPEYEKVGFNYLIDKYDSVNIITGQNLDSLYFIDSFAPSSNERGFIRKIKILYTSFKRFVFSIHFIRFVKFVSRTFSKIFINKYIGTFLNGFNEHRAPFFEKDLKYTSRFQSLFSSRENSYLELINENKIDLNVKLRSLKYLKFVQNTHRNYYNLKIKHKINRLNPFSEGLFVRFFLNYELKLKDSFFIKSECSDYLIDNNINYNRIASKFSKSSLYYMLREIFFMFPVDMQVNLGKIFKIKTSNYLFVKDKNDINEIEFALNLIKNNNNDLRETLSDILLKINGKNNLNKNEKMLLYKLKNVNNLLREYS